MRPVVRTRDGLVGVRLARRKPSRLAREASLVIVLLIVAAVALAAIVALR